MTGKWGRTLAGQLVEAGLDRAEADGLARDAVEEARDAGRDPQELYGPAVAYASTLVRTLHVAETRALGVNRGGGEVVLRLRSVSKSYGRREILRGIDLELRAGEITAVVGANGSGKSTLLGICAGVIRPSAGVVQRVPRIGYAPQLGGVAPLLTPDEHFRLFGAASRMGPGGPGGRDAGSHPCSAGGRAATSWPRGSLAAPGRNSTWCWPSWTAPTSSCSTSPTRDSTRTPT